MKIQKQSVFASVTGVKIILFTFTSLLASLTIFTHIAQISSLQFEKYLLFSPVIALITLIGVAIVSRKWISQINVKDRDVLLFILLISLIGAILSLIIHRSDSDDFYYIPNIIYYLQNPTAKMGFDIHFFYAEGSPFVSHMTNTALPYEYIQSILSYYTNIEFLWFYYLLFPAIVGALIPLSLFYALFYFSDKTRNNAIAVLITIAIILLLGETHRTVGNFAFARAFQGKALFLSTGIPLFTGFSLDYLKKPSLFSWIALFTVVTSMVGTTATACILLPALASIFVIIYSSKINRFRFKSLFGWIISYCLTLGYALIYALAIRNYALSYAGIDSPQNRGWPTDFWGHLNFFINWEIPLTLLIAISSMVVSLILSTKRKELMIWIAASFILYLNPLSAGFLIENVTSPNIYWRMFYILPFPLTFALSVSCILKHTDSFLKREKLIASVLLLMTFLLSLHKPLNKASVFSHSNKGARINNPKRKIYKKPVFIAKKIVQVAPPGVMLAPRRVAGYVTMIDSQYPQLASRTEGIETWLTYRNKAEEAQLRIEAAQFVAGDESLFNSFKKLVFLYKDLESIVIAKSIWEKAEVQDFLQQNGFAFYHKINQDLVLTSKSQLFPQSVSQ